MMGEIYRSQKNRILGFYSWYLYGRKGYMVFIFVCVLGLIVEFVWYGINFIFLVQRNIILLEVMDFIVEIGLIF